MSRQGLARSSPCLTLACNLRQYSLDKKRIASPQTQTAPKIVLEKIDLIGGNGRWRQKKAEEEFARRAIEEEAHKREMQKFEEERRKRRAAREARLLRRQQEEERRREAEREQQRQEQLEQEERLRKEQEDERLRKEKEEREWLARQPKTCQKCGGGGKCPKCLGKGYLFALILAPSVNEDRCFESGRIMEGCDECYGCRQNLMADLKKGTGRCSGCDGFGKIAPELGVMSPGTRRRASYTNFFGDESPGPASSPKGAFGMH